jgi:hypothetical protein
MRRIALLVAIFLVGLTTAPAFAKDLCVVNDFGQLLKFDRVQLLKGKTTVLVGRFHPLADDTNVPFNGAVTLDSDNVTTRIGIVGYPVGGWLSRSRSTWSVTKTLMQLVRLTIRRLVAPTVLTSGRK